MLAWPHGSGGDGSEPATNCHPAQVPLRMPPHVYETEACWIDVPESVAGAVATRDAHGVALCIDGGLHAAAHAVLAVLPLQLRCEPGDVGCECDALRRRALRPRRLLFYDRTEGGAGIARRMQAVMPSLLRHALQLTQGCTCAGGCWCCVHASKCPEYNSGTDKVAAIALLKALTALSERPRTEIEAADIRAETLIACKSGAATSFEISPDTSSTMFARSIRRMRQLAGDRVERVGLRDAALDG